MLLLSVQQVLSPRPRRWVLTSVNARRPLITSKLQFVFLLSTTITIAACAPFHPPAEPSSTRYYIVQPGDNFHSIAFLLETTPQQLQGANPWANSPQLQPGMRLTVPAATAASGGQYDSSADGGEPRIRSADFAWPLKNFQVSSKFGNRRGRLHAGIDLRAPRGTPIHAAADGRVVFSGRSGDYGRMVVIDHGGGVETAYAHNSRNLVNRGQRVKQGDIIGNVGRSGNATGYHLHFEFRRYGRPLNPVHNLQAAL